MDEALGLAIGLGSIGTSAQVTNLATIQGATKSPRDVAGAVVRHDTLDAADAVASEEAPCSFEEVHAVMPFWSASTSA